MNLEQFQATVGRLAGLGMTGGGLVIGWRQADNHVLMTGPVALEFSGRLPELETA